MKYAAVELWLVIEEHTNTCQKTKQITPLREKWRYLSKKRNGELSFFIKNNKTATEGGKQGFI